MTTLFLLLAALTSARSTLTVLGDWLNDSASAAAIVVDPLHGNDSIAGRHGLPFQTVTNATKAACNGDTIYIRNTATNYVQSIPGDGSGTFKALWHIANLTNITFTGDHGVVIQQINITGTWGYLLTWTNCTNVRFIGLQFNGDTNGSFNPCDVAGGCLMASGPSQGIEVGSCCFHNWPDQAISHEGGWAESARRLYVHDNFFDTIGNTNRSFGNQSNDGECISGLMGSGTLITHNHAQHVQGFVEWGYGGEANNPGAWLPCYDMMISDNVVTNFFIRGITIGGVATNGGFNNVRVVRNSIYGSVMELYNSIGVITVGGGTNITVSDNIISTVNSCHAAAGILFNPSGAYVIDNVVISDNTLRLNDMVAIECASLTAANTHFVRRAQITGNKILNTWKVAVIDGAQISVVADNDVWNVNDDDATLANIMLVNGTNSDFGLYGSCTNVNIEGNSMGGVASPGYFVANGGSLPITTLYFGPGNIAWNGVSSSLLLDTSLITSIVLTRAQPDPVPRPRFISQPARQHVHLGESTLFRVQASGPRPLHYQWLFNGHPVCGATNAFLILNGAQPANAGAYSAIVGSRWGDVVSEPASLTVDLTAPPAGDTNDLPSLRFASLEMVEPGVPLISVAVTNRHGVKIEWSSDCRTWNPLLTLTNNGGVRYFTDPDAVTQPRRFYRAMAQP
jgi:hypothetical protein